MHWTHFRYKVDEHGIIFLDVLVSVLIVIILNGCIWSVLTFSWHMYDRSSKQLEASEQVSVFIRQWNEDVGQSSNISANGSSLHLVLMSGGTVDYWYNMSPNALHIVRLVNGRGGEVACAHVASVVFQMDSLQSVHLLLDVANGDSIVHYEGFANSKIST